MKPPKERRPIEFHQVCAIARTVMEANPAIEDAEWKAATRDKATRQGYDTIPAEMLTPALTQVECAMVRTLGPRPLALPPEPQAPAPPQQHDPPWQRGRTPAGWTLVVQLLANLNALASVPSSGGSPEPAVDYAIDEHDAINVFWAEIRTDCDRIALLRAFAEVAIVRPAGWDPAEVRAKADEHHLFADLCFGCRSKVRDLAWHHVIQVQHGGSNTPRNRVALCGACHADVHPWLYGEPSPRRTPGWSSMRELIGTLPSLGFEKDGAA